MLRVFADAGLPVQRHYDGGVMELAIPLPSDTDGVTLGSYLNTVADRERSAATASLRHVLAPESLVVIGASRKRGTAGRAILDNILAGGYAGRVYVVNPRARQISGVHCLSSVLELPEPVDLAVVALPAAAVPGVAEQCGQRGVRSLVLISAGLDAAASADLLAVCRRHGMRLVGPDSAGVAVPSIGLDATIAARRPHPGVAGLVMQSGGLGLALAGQLSQLGIGISSFASVGSKLDVSSNDMLMWWEHDGVTRLAVLYIESFGNPRKFARTARRIGASMPVLAVTAGRSTLSEPTSTPAQLMSQEALLDQAGVIATQNFGELAGTAALLVSQPVPVGRTVAIVTNVSGAGRLAAAACDALGLTVHQPHGSISRRLRAIIPHTGAISGPVDTTDVIPSEHFRQCLELVAADEEIDALIALVQPTAATGDLVAALQQADVRVPLAAVVLDQPEAVRLIPRKSGADQIPAFGSPEAAVAAMARAARYGAWRTEPRGQVPCLPDLKTQDARALIHGYFRMVREGGWLPLDQTSEILRCYGIPVGEPPPVSGEDEAVDAFEGTELAIRVTNDHVFGPIVVLDSGSMAPGALGDGAVRLTPLTDLDADRLIGSLHCAPALRGLRGGPAASLQALRDLLLRVSRLAEDLPEIAELDLRPVVAHRDGIFVVATQLKVTPYQAHDPFLRDLR